jgi:hypothetical protein
MLDKTELTEFLCEQAINNNQTVNRIDIFCKLAEFESVFIGGTAAMCRFLKWGKEHKMLDTIIYTNIVHDLNGMHNKCFCPRTSTY